MAELNLNIDNMEKAGRLFTKGALEYIVGGVIGAAIIITSATVIACYCDLFTNDSDLDGFNWSGLKVRTDYKTGLQYLESTEGFLNPRLDVTGKQVVMVKK